MADSSKKLTPSTRTEMDAFLKQVTRTPAPRNGDNIGKLMFAMDATASREATWDHACHIQAEMFNATAAIGGLAVQLCYYRGFAEFHASPWLIRSSDLLHRMSSVTCLGGHTQIAKILKHAIAETKQHKINAVVFVGDCLEENIDDLSRSAGELALLGVPLFIFHEGHDVNAATGFRHLAQLTGGAYCAFDNSSAQQLKELLSAVAVYAAGGHKALENFNKRHGKVVLQLPGHKNR